MRVPPGYGEIYHDCMRTTVRLFLALPLLAALATATGCNTVSGTNRSQLNVLSQADERQLGDEAYQEALSEKGVKKVTSGPDYDRVQRVADRIEDAAGRLHAKAVRGFEWQWTVVNDDNTVNAWALPGGKSAVYTGMLRMAKSDDELAVVMGHEASHAIARHAGERISSNMVIQGALQGTAIALGDMSPAAQQATMAALGLGSNVGVLLPWSRMQESEADELGLLIAADAGYDPRTAIDLWTRMASQSGAPPEFLSTHPSENTRVKRLQKLMPKAMKLYQAALDRSGAAPAAK
ncbi:MAG: M48 family peptidase [Proteobacteria bacterium]|nr:M48 family peptidase [Pseudomonadota bacterium]